MFTVVVDGLELGEALIGNDKKVLWLLIGECVQAAGSSTTRWVDGILCPGI